MSHFWCPALLFPSGHEGSVGAIGSMRGARAGAEVGSQLSVSVPVKVSFSFFWFWYSGFGV